MLPQRGATPIDQLNLKTRPPAIKATHRSLLLSTGELFHRDTIQHPTRALSGSKQAESTIMRSGKSIDIDILNAGYRYALSLCPNRQDAEDIVHDAWIRLDKRYRKIPEKPLLYRTIRNLYIDRYRREQKINFSEFNELTCPPEATASQDLTPEEMMHFLNQLRDVEREALYLSVVEGYTADEIARMTSTARGSVLSLIHRSKTKLRTWMTGAKVKDVEVFELITGGKSDE